MKLSELVKKYNLLCAQSTSDVKKITDEKLQSILYYAQQDELESLRHDVLQAFASFETKLQSIRKTIHDQIRDQERPYLQESYRQYEQNRSYRYEWFKMELPENLPNYLTGQHEAKILNVSRHVESQLNKRLDISDASKELILNRITRYCGWQNTAMILHPGLETWIQHMVSCDPLYLVDEDPELLKPALTQFNELYQHRLRPYVLREDQEQDILWQLPDSQFGLILAWNYFDHRPFEVIRRYLVELFKKMCPGGMLLMTYNDCDRWPGVVAAEVGTGLYTPGSFIQNFAESVGFETVFNYNEDGTWTWIEFQKPGQRVSLRAGQALAKILPKPVAESK
jgi:hypothetical protein